MAKIMLESLVLRGVAVKGNVVNGLAGINSKQDMAATPAILSLGRHPSHCFLPANYQAEERRLHAGIAGMDTAADRTGRSESSLGVHASRSPAFTAGWPCLTAKPLASWVQAPERRFVASDHPQTLSAGGLRQPRREGPAERSQERRTTISSASETRKASTRGTRHS